MKLFGRQKHHPELHRQSSDESYSSTAPPSTSKTHRRTSSLFSFNEWSSGAAHPDPGSDASVKSSATDPLNISWSSSGSVGALSPPPSDVMWADSTIRRSDCLDEGGDVEDKRSSRALEIIRQLSFSPPRRTKKRADTADTADTASSSSSSDTDGLHDDSTTIGLLDLQHLEDLRRGSPSPLLGLQFLQDDEHFLFR